MLVMAGDSAEVSILMFAGHELVVPVHFRTSGLSDGYIQGHRCCSCCRLLLTSSAQLHELDVLPAASWRMVSIPLCCAILLGTQELPVTGFQTDDTVVTEFGCELFPAPGGAASRLICTLPSACAETYFPCELLSVILPPGRSSIWKYSHVLATSRFHCALPSGCALRNFPCTLRRATCAIASPPP